MTHSEFNDIYYTKADEVLRNHGFWRQNSHYVKQNETEFLIIYKNSIRSLLYEFTFVYCHTFMKNLDGAYSDKVILPQVSPFVFFPSELKTLMGTENGPITYVYDYEKVNEKSGIGNLPIDLENMSEREISEYIENVLNIAITDGLGFLKKLKPEFTLYQLKEYGKDLWIEKNWIADIESYLDNRKNIG